MNDRVARILSPGIVEISRLVRREPEPDEAVIHVNKLGLCGSDLHLYAGSYKGPHVYPIVPGHEWAGQIVQIGSQVEHFSVGDRVTGDASFWCGECHNCAKDRNLCIRIEKRGLTRDGAAADYIVTKAKYLYHIPVGVTDDIACLAEPFAVAWHAIHKVIQNGGQEIEHRRILVLGGGPIGMAILMILKKAYGCQDVFLHDLVGFRVDLAEKLGGKRLDPDLIKKRRAGETYSEMYASGGFDVVFESTGAAPVLDDALYLANSLGTIATLAPIRNVALSGGLHCLKALVMVGSIGGTGEFPEALELFSRDPEYFRSIVTHTFSLDDFEKALIVQHDCESRMIVEIDINN